MVCRNALKDINCSEASGLLGMTAGVFQSMWPRMKSPLTQMFQFVFLHKTLFSETTKKISG
jgi:hypothetical protein